MDAQPTQLDLANKPLAQPTAWQKFVAFRRRYVRPVWCLVMSYRLVASIVDLQDVLYVIGLVMASVGAERVCGDGYGLLSAGILLLIPTMAAMMSHGRKGQHQ